MTKNALLSPSENRFQDSYNLANKLIESSNDREQNKAVFLYWYLLFNLYPESPFEIYKMYKGLDESENIAILMYGIAKRLEDTRCEGEEINQELLNQMDRTVQNIMLKLPISTEANKFLTMNKLISQYHKDLNFDEEYKLKQYINNDVSSNYSNSDEGTTDNLIGSCNECFCIVL